MSCICYQIPGFPSSRFDIVILQIKCHPILQILRFKLHSMFIVPCCVYTLREKCPNTELFPVRIFLHSD